MRNRSPCSPTRSWRNSIGPGERSRSSTAINRVSSAKAGNATRQHVTSSARFQGGRGGWTSDDIAARKGGGGRGTAPGKPSRDRICGGRRQRGHRVSVEAGAGSVHGRGRGKTHSAGAWHCVGPGGRAEGIPAASRTGKKLALGLLPGGSGDPAGCATRLRMRWGFVRGRSRERRPPRGGPLGPLRPCGAACD